MTDFRDPSRAQFEVFKSLPRDTPINMLNLVQFFDRAQYPADHALAGDDLTGAQAYANYGAASAPVLKRVGATIIWRGKFDATLIGDSAEVWDAMFIAQYPDAGAFLAMITDPDYQRAVIHRQAAVTNSRLVRCAPQTSGDLFA